MLLPAALHPEELPSPTLPGNTLELHVSKRDTVSSPRVNPRWCLVFVAPVAHGEWRIPDCALFVSTSEPRACRTATPRNSTVSSNTAGLPEGHRQPPERGSCLPTHRGSRTVYPGAPTVHRQGKWGSWLDPCQDGSQGNTRVCPGRALHPCSVHRDPLGSPSLHLALMPWSLTRSLTFGAFPQVSSPAQLCLCFSYLFRLAFLPPTIQTSSVLTGNWSTQRRVQIRKKTMDATQVSDLSSEAFPEDPEYQLGVGGVVES